MTIQPCGHGNCEDCLRRISNSDAANCPLCRTPILKYVPNYDLIEITEKVNRDTSYWGRRLMETVNIPGETIQISDSIKPYCKLLCYRLAISNVLKAIDTTMTLEEYEEVDKMKNIFTRCLHKTNANIEDAFTWLKVLNLPLSVHAYLVEEIAEWYDIKYFLEKNEAVWIMHALSI